ncbi:hypothetical protein GWG54_16950 [Natronococcus sp. JC468]|uniref:hypothetical protein n=1 Tax=Natronococcus sp. JC468 TaxID=1961921 RepID=UPI00143C13FF|nr:hypothetical protein [Natronococcus sp. JC468]NKE37465.1 hypothetical protein [Natronococcus sp. JC468]
MPSDRNSDETEKVIERELEKSTTGPRRDESQREAEKTGEREFRHPSTRQPRNESQPEAVVTIQKQLVENRETSKLSEAAVDLTFALFEAAFAIVAVVLVILTATTSLSLYTAAGACLLFVGIFEVVRRLIKSLDEFQKAFTLAK